MTKDSLTITLAGREFSVSHLTIEQSMNLRIGDAKKRPDDDSGGWRAAYMLAVETIAVAISANHPEVTEKEIWQFTANEEEMGNARKAILEFAGFRSPDPSIAELRAQVIAKKLELEEMEKTLATREAKAKETGEG